MVKKWPINGQLMALNCVPFHGNFMANSLLFVQYCEQLLPRQVVIHLPKYVTHIIGEPKYKYGQQEQVTVRNHNRSTAFERSVLKYWVLEPVLWVRNLARVKIIAQRKICLYLRLFSTD